MACSSQAGKNATKNGKGGKPWTTERQRAWLANFLIAYEEAQSCKKRGAVKTFRRGVLDEFIAEFWKGKVMSADERAVQIQILDTVSSSFLQGGDADCIIEAAP